MTRQEQNNADIKPVSGFPADICDEIRRVLNRQDLSNETLRETLDHAPFDPKAGLSLLDFTGGRGRPEQRVSLIRSLPVPPPRHGLAMPAHDLNPPPGVRFAPAIRLWHRVLLTARPQMKRARVVARDR